MYISTKEQLELKPTIVGYADVSTGMWCYIRDLPWEKEDYKSKNKRQICHIKKKIVYTPQGNIYGEGYRDERIEKFFSRIYPEWGVGLAMKYTKGGKIRKHIDTTGYGHTAYSVSSCDYILEVANNKYQIPKFVIISFPSKVPHAAYCEKEQERLVICCWKYTPRYK